MAEPWPGLVEAYRAGQGANLNDLATQYYGGYLNSAGIATGVVYSNGKTIGEPMPMPLWFWSA